MEVAGDSSKKAFDTLSKIGEIESGSRVKQLEAAGTVTKENLIIGKGLADLKNILAKSTQSANKALNDFAAES